MPIKSGFATSVIEIITNAQALSKLMVNFTAKAKSGGDY